MSEIKIFLYAILDLIKNQKRENISFIEENLNNGIATVLYSKYSEYFDRLCIGKDNLLLADNYYKKYAGVADGCEGKYACEENDGLYLIVKLALES